MRKQKKMGAPLKRNMPLTSTGITPDLDSKYKTLAESSFIRKTELKRLALEWVMAGIESGRLAVHREHHETTIVEVVLPEARELELQHMLDALLRQLPNPPTPNENGEYGLVYMSVGAPIWETAERAHILLNQKNSNDSQPKQNSTPITEQAQQLRSAYSEGKWITHADESTEVPLPETSESDTIPVS